VFLTSNRFLFLVCIAIDHSLISLLVVDGDDDSIRLLIASLIHEIVCSFRISSFRVLVLVLLLFALLTMR